MVKFPEAEQRLFKDVFVCRRCKTKMKSSNMLVMAGVVKCRNCGRRALRPIKRK